MEQQQTHSHGQERKKPADSAKTSPEQASGDGARCPHCGETVPSLAAFCPECGFAIGGLPCPSCGALTPPGADICERCGAWLLTGQCVFCQKPIPEGAAYCPECGQPQAGIPCPSCGTTNIFDFCSKCNAPLSEAAHAMMVQAATDPKIKADLDVIMRPAQIDAEIERLNAEISAAEAKASEAGFGGGDGPDGGVTPEGARPARGQDMSDALRKKLSGAAAAQGAAKPAPSKGKGYDNRKTFQEEQRELRLKREELERERERARAEAEMLSTSYKDQRFGHNQDARLFYNAHRPAKPIGWLCNYAEYLHPVPDGPNDCYLPMMGGRWITED